MLRFSNRESRGNPGAELGAGFTARSEHARDRAFSNRALSCEVVVEIFGDRGSTYTEIIAEDGLAFRYREPVM